MSFEDILRRHHGGCASLRQSFWLFRPKLGGFQTARQRQTLPLVTNRFGRKMEALNYCKLVAFKALREQ